MPILAPWTRRRITRRPGPRSLPAFVAPGGSPPAVTFPTEPLAFRVYFAPGADLSADPLSWPWCDITAYVRHEDGIRVTRGRRPDSDQVMPGEMSLTVDNNASDDPGDPYPQAGRFARRNPNGPWFGQLTRNTPIWVQVDPGSGYVTRFQGFVNEWPVRWSDKSGNDSTVRIGCAGILRRLEATGRSRSGLRLAISGALAHWPMEDGEDATQAASNLTNGAPMVARGVLAFGAEGPPGAAAAADLSGGMVCIGALSGVSSTSWSVVWAASNTESDDASFLRVTLTSGGTYKMFAPHPQGPLFGAGINALDSTGSFSGPVSAAREDDLDTGWHWYMMTAAQNGGNIDLELFRDGASLDSASVAGTLTAPIAVSANEGVLPVDPLPGSMCHVAVFDGEADDYTNIMSGRPGETAVARVIRLCEENGVTLSCTSPPGVSPAMGPHPTGNLLALLRECEDVDGGELFEAGFGLGYRSRWDLSNQPVTLALDADQGHLSNSPRPDDDDRYTRNQWTVSRPSGSEYTHEVSDGPLGTGTVGTWDDQLSVNVHTDDLLRHQASWRTTRDTIDEGQWSEVELNFARNPDLIAGYVALDHGGRVTIANPPDEPDDVDAMVIGLSERLTSHSWMATLNTLPNAANHVFRTAEDSGDADEFLGYLIPDSCVLAAAIDDSTTSVQITSTPLWSEDPDDWSPGALVVVGGERMLVTAVSGSGNPQTLTVTRSVNGITKSHSAGDELEFVSPGYVGL